jgi:histone H3/H4
MQTEHDLPCSSRNIIDMMQNIYPLININNKAMGILLDIARSTLKRLCVELALLTHRTNLIQTRDVISAVTLVYVRELARQAIFNINHFVQDSCGLKIDCTRVHKALENVMPKHRFGKKAVIAITAAIEYIIHEILEISGHPLNRTYRSHIAPVNIHSAIALDDELSELFNEVLYNDFTLPEPSIDTTKVALMIITDDEERAVPFEYI